MATERLGPVVMDLFRVGPRGALWPPRPRPDCPRGSAQPPRARRSWAAAPPGGRLGAAQPCPLSTWRRRLSSTVFGRWGQLFQLSETIKQDNNSIYIFVQLYCLNETIYVNPEAGDRLLHGPPQGPLSPGCRHAWSTEVPSGLLGPPASRGGPVVCEV